MGKPTDLNADLSEDEIRESLSSPPDPLLIFFALADQTVGALQQTLEHLSRVPGEPRSWKWALLGAHAALHGAFSLVLERTDGFQLYGRKDEKKLQKNLANRMKDPHDPQLLKERVEIIQENPKIDPFLELLQKVCNPQRTNYLASVPLKPTKEQKESLERLNAHRGLLVHFSRETLALTASEMTDVLDDALHILETLLTRTRYMSPDVNGGPISTIADPKLADEADVLLKDLKSELGAARQRCEAVRRSMDASR